MRRGEGVGRRGTLGKERAWEARRKEERRWGISLDSGDFLVLVFGLLFLSFL